MMLSQQLSKDVLRTIALQINDKLSWYAFALVCKTTARIVSELTSKLRAKYEDFDNLKHSKFFQMMKINMPITPLPDTVLTFFNSHIIRGLDQSVALGDSAFARECSVSIGRGSNSYYDGVSIGSKTVAEKASVAIGYQAIALHHRAIVIGSNESNGHGTFVATAPGRFGEGFTFRNGAKRAMRSKRYNDGMCWSYDPATPDHWGDHPPTSTAEAIDRISARLFEMSNGKSL